MATLISAQRNGRRDSDFKISSFGQFDINSQRSQPSGTLLIVLLLW